MPQLDPRSWHELETIIDKFLFPFRAEPLPYVGSLDACAIAEVELVRRGLGSLYAAQLEKIVSEYQTVFDYSLIIATPRQRCEAIVATLDAHHNEMVALAKRSVDASVSVLNGIADLRRKLEEQS